MEVTEWGGINKPSYLFSVSPADHARIYYSSPEDHLMLSENGMHYAPIITSWSGTCYFANVNHQHPEYTGAHSEYVPYLNANRAVDLGTNHFTASVVQAQNELYGSYLASNITGLGFDMTGIPWYISVTLDSDDDFACAAMHAKIRAYSPSINGNIGNFPEALYSTHQHDEAYADIDHQHSEYSLIGHTHPHTHPVATVLNAGFVDTLPNDATRYWDGTGNYSVPAGGGGSGGNYSALFTNTHPNYDAYNIVFTNQHPESYVDLKTGHTHPMYLPPIIDAANQHAYVENLTSQHLISHSIEASNHLQVGVYYFPNTVGSANQVLVVNPSISDGRFAHLSWADQSGTGGSGGNYSSLFAHNHYTLIPNGYVPYVGCQASDVELINTTGTYQHLTAGTLRATDAGISIFGTEVDAPIGSFPSALYSTHQHPKYQLSSVTDNHPLYMPYGEGGSLQPGHSHPTYDTHSHPNYQAANGGICIGAVPFEKLAAPQSFQGIEQLRHQVQTYETFGEIVVDGFQDNYSLRDIPTNMAHCPTSISHLALRDYATLLSHFDGVDAATSYLMETGQVCTFSGNTQLDTAQYKFGPSSVLFDGSDDFLTVPDSDAWNFGLYDFEIDMWVRFNALGTVRFVGQQEVPTDDEWYFQYNNGTNKLSFYSTDGAAVRVQFNATWTPAANTWYHIRVSRKNITTWGLFVNGQSLPLTLQAGAWDNALHDFTPSLHIGSNEEASYFMNGWIDELHIVRGSGDAPTTTFAVPLIAYGDTGGFMHSKIFPYPFINMTTEASGVQAFCGAPQHIGVALKMDDAFYNTAGLLSNQHNYLRVWVSRDGTNWSECHPIVACGSHGYYRATMTNVSTSVPQHSMTTKILLNSSSRVLRGYGIYGQ